MASTIVGFKGGEYYFDTFFDLIALNKIKSLLMLDFGTVQFAKIKGLKGESYKK